MTSDGSSKLKVIPNHAIFRRYNSAGRLGFIIALTLLVILVLFPAVAAQRQILKNNGITVVYEPPLESIAAEIAGLYPEIRQELHRVFGWSLDVGPQVVLVKTNQAFQKMVRNELFVALAIPDRNLIVIDYTKMNVHPFSLRTTFKHELCHLMLHRYIDERNLPKWLDEGICQWASDGIGEIFINKGWSGLDAAVLADRIIPLERLADNFPGEKSSLILAYEQSKSVVKHIVREFGDRAIVAILNDLRNGRPVEAAFRNSLSLTPDQLEQEWLDNIQHTPRWLVFFANNIYGILFFLAAVLTFFGFIRLFRHRRKVYREWEEDEKDG